MASRNVLYIKGYPIQKYQALCECMQKKVVELNLENNSQIRDLNNLNLNQSYLGYEINADSDTLQRISLLIKEYIINLIHNMNILTFEDYIQIGILNNSIKIKKNSQVPINFILEESKCIQYKQIDREAFILDFKSSKDTFFAINRLDLVFNKSILTDIIDDDLHQLIFTNHEVASLLDSDSEGQQIITSKKNCLQNTVTQSYQSNDNNKKENNSSINKNIQIEQQQQSLEGKQQQNQSFQQQQTQEYSKQNSDCSLLYESAKSQSDEAAFSQFQSCREFGQVEKVENNDQLGKKQIRKAHSLYSYEKSPYKKRKMVEYEYKQKEQSQNQLKAQFNEQKINLNVIFNCIIIFILYRFLFK